MMAAILNSAILDSAILHKKNFTRSIWLNLMMAAILNSAILDSDTAILDSNTLLSSLRFTQKHSSSTLTLIQSNSIWLTSWWQPSRILPSWIQPFYIKLWLKLVQSDSNSFILTQLDDGSNIEFCHPGFSHLSSFSQTLSHLPRLVPNICTKNLHSFNLTQLHDGSHLEFCHLGFNHFAQKITSLIHSDSTWWWQPSWILPCWIQTLPYWIQTPCYLLSDSLKNTLPALWLCLKLIPSD